MCCKLLMGHGGSLSLHCLLVGFLERQARACLGSPSSFHPKDRRSTNASAKVPDLVFSPKTCVACSKNGRDAEFVCRSRQRNLPGAADKRRTRCLKTWTGRVSR